MNRYFVFQLLIFLIFYSCKTNDRSRTVEKTNFILDLQPFDGITIDETQYVFNELKKVYPFVVINGSIPLPHTAYYKARNRYRADSLINILSKQAPAGHKVVGLINVDISTTKNGIADWGIMGLDFVPARHA